MKEKKIWHGVETQPFSCPYCGRILDCVRCAFTDETGSTKPEKGDANVCANCGGLSMVNADGTISKPTISQLIEWKTDEEKWGSISRVKALIHRLGEP